MHAVAPAGAEELQKQSMIEQNGGAQARALQVSRRILCTETPVIAFTRRAMALRADAISLAQGIVYWGPPPEALAAAAAALQDPVAAQAVSSYGPNEGLPELRAALRHKVETANGLKGYNICVTHGGNQAFVNLVLSLVDEGDSVVLFRPAYFDHLMTVTQTGGAANIVWGERDPVTMHPSLPWLKQALAGPEPPKMVVLCNPCNPTGVLLPKEEIEAISEACGAAGAWLVVDETYEDFCWGDRTHHCVCAPHVLHIFSFSKAFGMMGWRVGYIAYPDPDGKDMIGAQLLKCQDTICICATQLSQRVALAALQHGQQYKQEKIASLEGNRQLLLDALSPLLEVHAAAASGAAANGKQGEQQEQGQGQGQGLGSSVVAGGEGALYLWAKLPPGCENDVAAVEWLVKAAGVCLVPGSSCGSPGWVRCSFGNLPPSRMGEATSRLKAGLQKMVAEGIQG